MADATTTLNALRRTPASHLTSEMREASAKTAGAVELTELSFPVQIGLRADLGSESARALEGVLGFALPPTVGQVTGDLQGLHVLWLSPDEFLAVDVSTEQEPGAADAYADAIEGLSGHAVDLSANRTVLVLRGEKATDVLSKGTHADLHPREFPVNQAIVTALGPVNIYLHRSGDSEWRIYPRASFADFTVRWLIDAMREFAA